MAERESSHVALRLRPRWLFASALIAAVIVAAALLSGFGRSDLASAASDGASGGYTGPLLCGGPADIAANDLGGLAWTLRLTPDQLRWELSHGQTLAGIIAARGLTAPRVVDSLAVQSRRQLDRQVARQLSRSQEDAALTRLRARLEQEIAANSLATPQAGTPFQPECPSRP